MKLQKIIRKNWLLLLVLVVIVYFLIKNTNEGFQAIGSACDLPSITQKGTCRQPDNRMATASASTCFTYSCPTGTTLYDNVKCKKMINNRQVITNADKKPLNSYHAYHCPTGYTKIGNYMCSKDQKGKMKCPTGYSVKHNNFCHMPCPPGGRPVYSYNNNNLEVMCTYIDDEGGVTQVERPVCSA